MKSVAKALLLLLAFAGTVLADESGVAVRFQEQHSSIFGDSKAQFHVSLASKALVQARVGWQFSAVEKKWVSPRTHF